jgi:hypothetical protein
MTYDQASITAVAFGVGALGIIAGVLFATAIGKAKRRDRVTGHDEPSELARRIDTLDGRFANVEHMLEVIAVEIERTGEGQRYLTQVLAKGSAGDRNS